MRTGQRIGLVDAASDLKSTTLGDLTVPSQSVALNLGGRNAQRLRI
jgi:hypothetical protein